MKTIYVVVENVYDYDDSYSNPILVTPSKVTADAKVAEMENRFAQKKKAQELVRAHIAEWDTVNKRPRPLDVTAKSLPNYGPQRNKWSKEQIAEYNMVLQGNHDRVTNALKPDHDWCKARYDEQIRFTKTLSEQDQVDLKEIQDKSSWIVEEVPYED
jgi:hypothetical protein